VCVLQVGTGPDYRDRAVPLEALTLRSSEPHALTPPSVPVGFVLTQALAA
jgi:hypothetical protein